MIAKLFLFAAFIAGAVGFVLPFIVAVHPDGGLEIGVSALQLVQGVEGVQAAMAASVAEAADAAIAEEVGRSFGAMADQVRAFVAIVFGPTVLFLLLGLLGIRRFGRGLGVTALLLGGLTVAGWFLISSAAGHADTTEVGFGLGFTLVLVGGALAVVGGIAGLAAPQLRGDLTPAVSSR